MRKLTLILISSLLISCGGGGGGGSNSNPTPTTPAPTTYTINGQVYGSSLSGLNAYSDANSSGALDNSELSVSVGSNGSFSLSTTNQSLYNCLRDMPLAAESSSNYFFSYNPDGSSGTVILNPFVSVFSDFLYPYYYWDNPSVDGSNCSILNNIRVNMLRINSENVLERIETYDGLTYSDLTINPSNPVADNPIDNSRTADFQNFWQSIQSIEQSVFNEFKAEVDASEYAGAQLASRSELDTSNLRIFLNNASYPNPSTDTTPVANNIDSVAVQAGAEIIGSFNNAVGTWNDVVKVSVNDIHISNNGEMLFDRSECWINFSNLCKIEPTLTNILRNYPSEIKQIYQKETSRGVEMVMREEFNEGGSSDGCFYYDDVMVADSSNTSITTTGYYQYYDNGYYDASDLQCYAYNNNWQGIYIGEDRTNGESLSIYLEQYRPYGDLPVFSSIRNTGFDYDTLDEGQNIEQIPSEFIDAFLDMSLSWDEMRSIVDSDFSEYDVWLSAYYYDKQGDRVALEYSPYYWAAYCFSPDIPDAENEGTDSVRYFTSNTKNLDDVINYCKTRAQFGYDVVRASGQVRNKSPYRGYIDD